MRTACSDWAEYMLPGRYTSMLCMGIFVSNRTLSIILYVFRCHWFCYISCWMCRQCLINPGASGQPSRIPPRQRYSANNRCYACIDSALQEGDTMQVPYLLFRWHEVCFTILLMMVLISKTKEPVNLVMTSAMVETVSVVWPTCCNAD